jgi:hypothetical protein
MRRREGHTEMQRLRDSEVNHQARQAWERSVVRLSLRSPSIRQRSPVRAPSTAVASYS